MSPVTDGSETDCPQLSSRLQAKISGSWRSMRTLAAFCRVRSCIVTAKAMVLRSSRLCATHSWVIP
jgi:hypothetical protein